MGTKRQDQAGDGGRLTDNPFHSLGPAGHAPAAPDPPPLGRSAKDDSGKAPRWRVSQARKGGWRLSMEKRPGGKAVTLLRGVEGDATALLKGLRKHCGAGGATAGDDGVEIQGDHRASIAAWLDARGGEG